MNTIAHNKYLFCIFVFSWSSTIFSEIRVCQRASGQPPVVLCLLIWLVKKIVFIFFRVRLENKVITDFSTFFKLKMAIFFHIIIRVFKNTTLLKDESGLFCPLRNLKQQHFIFRQ